MAFKNFYKEQKLCTLPCWHWPSITQFLAFPKVEISQPWKKPREESLIDCTKSIMMTSKHYLISLTQKETREEATIKDRKCKRQNNLQIRKKMC
jgi:hypothetical protein